MATMAAAVLPPSLWGRILLYPESYEKLSGARRICRGSFHANRRLSCWNHSFPSGELSLNSNKHIEKTATVCESTGFEGFAI